MMRRFIDVAGKFGAVMVHISFLGCSETVTVEARLDDGVALQMQSVPTHWYLAEFQRTLRLQHQGRTVSEISLAVDTGGYARVNVYRLDDGKHLLKTYFEDAIVVDSENRGFKRNKALWSAQGLFLGAFDHDKRGWQFFSAQERPELPVKIQE